MNKIILIGRFTKDPESRMTQSNTEVSRFSLACSSDFVNKDGKRETEFINCIAFNKLASTINRYCKKGTLISVTGRIKNRSYDAQDGTKRYATDIVVEQMEFLSSKSGDNTVNQNSSSQSSAETSANSLQNSAETSANSLQNSADPYEAFGQEFELSSDQLPF